MENNNIPGAAFGVACSFGILNEDYSEEDDLVPPIFFVTFNTRDEALALQLAKCVCGTESLAKQSLVVLDKDGRIW